MINPLPSMDASEVQWEQADNGVSLTIFPKHKPGPVVRIGPQGEVEVNKGPYDEAGRMFWDAVRVAGSTYREHIAELNKVIELLQHDPYRDAVCHRGFDVHQALSSHYKKRLTYVDVSAVLEAVHKLAMEKCN